MTNINQFVKYVIFINFVLIYDGQKLICPLDLHAFLVRKLFFLVENRCNFSHGDRYLSHSSRHTQVPVPATSIFINGCFWHGHKVTITNNHEPITIENSECCKIPKTNREFWVAKIKRNQERDIEEQKVLAEMGWHCITV